jgi:hypothetical protein
MHDIRLCMPSVIFKPLLAMQLFFKLFFHNFSLSLNLPFLNCCVVVTTKESKCSCEFCKHQSFVMWNQINIYNLLGEYKLTLDIPQFISHKNGT